MRSRTRSLLPIAGVVAVFLVLAFFAQSGAADPALDSVGETIGEDASGAGKSGVLLLLAALAAMVVLGAPLFLIIGVLSTLCFVLFGDGYDDLAAFQVFPATMANLTTKNVLLAIPFFVVSGAIMSAGDIANRLVAFARALVSFLPGGLAIATVGGCIFFAAISGSSPVTVIAIGSMMYPALVRAGYKESFSLGLVTTAGSLGILIPPSIPMLVYAIAAGGRRPLDVGELFMAGILPGALIGVLLSLYSMAVAGRAEKTARSRVRLSEVWTRFTGGFWAVMLPVLILGGIYSGLFTATEAAAVSVIYALVVELFIHREISVRDLPGILSESAVMMGTLLIIMALAFGLNDFLVEAKIPDRAVEWIQTMDLSVVGFLLMVNVFLLLVGALMDSISAILIIAPLLAPIAYQLGVDPVHLGVIFIVNLEIGYLTPPIGINLFVSSAVFHKSMGAVIRSVMPFILLMFVGLGIVTYVPSLALGPVNALMRDKDFYEPFPEPHVPKGGAMVAPQGVEPPKIPIPGDARPVAPEGKRVLSIEEMMEKAEQERGKSAPTGAAGDTKRVLSIEEMMEIAEQKKAEEEKR